MEFKISSEGTVVLLKNKIRRYLDEHRDTLFNNPRFTALYPKARRVTQPVAPRPPAVRHQIVRPPSPALSISSNSTTSSDHSYESWNGIQAPPLHHDPPIQPLPQEAAPLLHSPAHYEPPAHHYHLPPPPSLSAPGSNPDPFLFGDHDDGPRKFFPFLYTFISLHDCGLIALPFVSLPYSFSYPFLGIALSIYIITLLWGVVLTMFSPFISYPSTSPPSLRVDLL